MGKQIETKSGEENGSTVVLFICPIWVCSPPEGSGLQFGGLLEPGIASR